MEKPKSHPPPTRIEVRRCILQAIHDARFLDPEEVAQYYAKVLIPQTAVSKPKKLTQKGIYDSFMSCLFEFLHGSSIEYDEDDVGGVSSKFPYNTRYYFSYPHRRKREALLRAEEAFLSSHPKGQVLHVKDIATMSHIQRITVPEVLQIAALGCCLKKSLIQTADFLVRTTNDTTSVTQTQIASQFGVRKNSVHTHISKLEELGVLYRVKGKPRMSLAQQQRYTAAIQWIKESVHADKFMRSDCGD